MLDSPRIGMWFITDHCLGLVPAQSQHTGCALFRSDVYRSTRGRHPTDRNFWSRHSDGTESRTTLLYCILEKYVWSFLLYEATHIQRLIVMYK